MNKQISNGVNKNIIAIASLFLALTFFLPVSSFALMIERSAEELAQDAKVIVQGEVKNVRSYKGINGVIYTRALVMVNDVIKGKNIKKNITVEYEGGEVGDVGVWVEDEPSLEKGERALLFLTNSFWRKNVYYIVGGVLGKYAICSDDTVRIGSSCDENNETDKDINEEEIQNSEELPFMETENTEETKQTLDELLNTIGSAK